MIRPRRSALFMPGTNARAVEKSRSLPADVVILDLEDAVAPDAKASARKAVAAALRSGGWGPREVVVRVNALGTPWGGADIETIAGAGVDALLLPKVDAPDTVRDCLRALDAAGAPRTLALWCMLETPRGILNAATIATADRPVAALVVGTSDLTKDLRARHTRDRLPLLTSLELCVLAARAAGIAVLDGVHLDLDDDAGLEAACRQAVDLGFDGKTLIHPKHLAVANAVFTPTTDDVAWARRVITAHGEAAAQGRGVAVLDGRLIETLHVAEARRVVALVEAIDAAARAHTTTHGGSR